MNTHASPDQIARMRALAESDGEQIGIETSDAFEREFAKVRDALGEDAEKILPLCTHFFEFGIERGIKIVDAAEASFAESMRSVFPAPIHAQRDADDLQEFQNTPLLSDAWEVASAFACAAVLVVFGFVLNAWLGG